MRISSTIWGVGLGLCLTSGVVLAQEQAEDGQAAGEPAASEPSDTTRKARPPDPDSLEEIVVTAQKRKESLQDTPISISAFNAEKLEQRGIDGLDDLSGNVPGLTIEPFPTNHTTLRFFIRGIGIIDTQLTQDPPVGVYIDGIYIARATGLALDIADLERIEVLRGPQGTLYGRNTTGGAINLITKRPSIDAFSMTHKLGFGNRNNLVARTSFNVPLADNLAFKLAALKSQRDGFVENTGPGSDFGDSDETGLRFDARWQPLDWFTTDYAYDNSDLTHVNYMFQAVRPSFTDHGSAELFKPFAQANTVYSEDRLKSLSSGPPYEPSTSKIEGHALTLTSNRWDNHELKYIVAKRNLTDATYADLGGGKGSLEYRLDSNAYAGPAADVANGGPTPLVIPEVRQEQWSHELQLTGKLLDNSSLEYVAGLFYFSEKATEDRHRLNHQLSTALSLTQLDEVDPNIPELDGLFNLLAGLGISPDQVDNARIVNFVNLNWDIDNKAKAFYVQGTWTPPNFLDQRLHLTAGFRRSEDSRKAVKFRISDTYLELLLNNGAGLARLLSSEEFFNNVPASRDFDNNSFSYIAAFDVNDNFNIYAKSVQGYRSGGFNVRDPQISAASGPASDGTNYGVGFVEGFDPELFQSYELGLKSEWLDRRLRLNTGVYATEIEDLQINFLIPGTVFDTKVLNAGRAETKGLELEATYLARPGLVLSGEYAYLDAKVLEVIDVNGNNVANLFPFTSAPKHTLSGGVDWVFLKKDWGNMRLGLIYNYVSERQGTVITEERRGLTSLPAYGLLNARLGIDTLRLGGNGLLDIGFWAKNLAGEEYPVVAIDNLPQADRAVVWGEPRTVGMDFIYRWN